MQWLISTKYPFSSPGTPGCVPWRATDAHTNSPLRESEMLIAPVCWWPTAKWTSTSVGHVHS